MACAHPITIRVHGDSYKVPCRQCLPCRIAYQSSLCFAATLELQKVYSLGQGASFCTLTYSDDYIPGSVLRMDEVPRSLAYGSLFKRDLQLFFKRVRYQLGKSKWSTFKHVSCGEYGDSFDRCHYHVIFIGLCDIEADKVIRDNWKYGLYDAQALGRGGLRYVTKYCTKQLKGDKAIELYDNNGFERPFLIRSVKMGYDYLNANIAKIADDNYMYNKNGIMVPIPAYYRKVVDKYRHYDKMPSVEVMAKVAKTLGMDYNSYIKYNARNMERMLIASVRASGLPVDDFNFNLGGNCYSAPRIEDALDPVPF